jgi:hypothetical protein
VAHHPSTGIRGKKKSMTKILSITIAGILIASVVAAISMGNAKPFKLDPVADDMSVDPHDSKLLVLHSHVHMELLVDGQLVSLPPNIGIDPALYNDHSFEKYAVTAQMAPIHTHSTDGLIHIESTVVRDYTVGEFLDIWGLDFSQIRTISMLVDGQSVPDYENHVLKDGQQILLEIGL